MAATKMATCRTDNETTTTDAPAWRPVGRDDYIRNISVVDWSDSSGDVIARTCVATMAEDLLFLFGTGSDDTECPKVYEACVKVADAYAKGEPYDEYADFLRIEFRRD